MESVLNQELIENIWNDAQFESLKKEIVLSATELKKNSIRKVTDYNLVLAYCKVCNCEMKISCEYSGDYPLCYRHREPNNRPLKSGKNKMK